MFWEISNINNTVALINLNKYKLKVSKFQNEFIMSSFPPKYEQKIIRISALYSVKLKSEILTIFSFIFSQWPILCWNVSKSWLQKIDFFENYAIVAREIDTFTFYACKIIKGTSGFNLKKTNFFARWCQHPKNSWNIFQIQITPLLWCPQQPQGCLEKQNHPLSSNLVVWCAKIGSETKKLRKSVKNHHFLTFFLSFLKFFERSWFWAQFY